MATLRDKTFFGLIVLVVLLGLQTIRLNSMLQHHREVTEPAGALNRIRKPSIKAKEIKLAKTPMITSLRVPSLPANASVVKQATPKTNSDVGSATTFLLDISEPASNVSSVCPLPLLHPWKFQDKMTWGVRKKFPACSVEGKMSTVEESVFDMVSGQTVATVKIDQSHCPNGGTVLTFHELKDEELPRMSSVMDAEVRQNELKDRFANDPQMNFAAAKRPFGSNGHPWLIEGIREPYVLVMCGGTGEGTADGGSAHAKKELHIRSEIRPSRRSHWHSKKERVAKGVGKTRNGVEIRNILHVMFDSTSIQAFRRSATRCGRFLETMGRNVSSPAAAFTFKHYHAVSCCSPGNQVPMYSGNINGEGDRFVEAEPFRSSKDWIWNVADAAGFTTFWSLDNCPDKSARDYHATPSVDSRVVAPLCLAGVLLSHKELECLAGKTVDQHVIDSLESFWEHHRSERKFAAVQFITPHEETEKQLLELDDEVARFFTRFEAAGHLDNTAVVFWSDHGINFGKYASTHDGEFEKLFPFASVLIPRSVLRAPAASKWAERLAENQDRLTSPYDMYELTRALISFPEAPTPFAHDPANPPLPRPQDSHIMASFQKPVTPVNPLLETVPYNRTCMDANIPQEFCTCISWRVLHEDQQDVKNFFQRAALAAHTRLVSNVSTATGFRQGLCSSVELAATILVEIQEWPREYHPKEQPVAKRMWMMPNRDMIRVQYSTKSGAIFEASFSAERDNNYMKTFDLAKLDRLDAMKTKCGVVDKVAEQLCECV